MAAPDHTFDPLSPFVSTSTLAPTHGLYSLSLHDALPIWRRTRTGLRRAVRLAPPPPDVRLPWRPAHAGLLHSLAFATRSEEHTSELQSPCNIVCRLLLEKKKLLLIYSLCHITKNIKSKEI